MSAKRWMILAISVFVLIFGGMVIRDVFDPLVMSEEDSEEIIKKFPDEIDLIEEYAGVEISIIDKETWATIKGVMQVQSNCFAGPDLTEFYTALDQTSTPEDYTKLCNAYSNEIYFLKQLSFKLTGYELDEVSAESRAVIEDVRLIYEMMTQGPNFDKMRGDIAQGMLTYKMNG